MGGRGRGHPLVLIHRKHFSAGSKSISLVNLKLLKMNMSLPLNSCGMFFFFLKFLIL